MGAPLDFTPKKYLASPRAGRFDDPVGKYRTLYCAGSQIVALREVLQGFKHSVRVLRKLSTAYGSDNVPPAIVPSAWLQSRVLAPCRVQIALGAKDLVNYEAPQTLQFFEKELASFLDIVGVSALDTSTTRSQTRVVSQVLGRSLYQEGHAGVAFSSRFSTTGPCYALFEGRAWLKADGAPRDLLSDARALLLRCCREFGLKVE